jgi:hypothetical protein
VDDARDYQPRYKHADKETQRVKTFEIQLQRKLAYK